MSPQATAAAPHIAYLVSQYPATSHTFILREVIGLRKGGMQIATASINADPRKALLHLFHFTEALMIGRWMQQQHTTHLHVHFATAAASVASLTRQVFPIALSMTVHGPDEFANVHDEHFAEKIQAADFVVCISNFARSQTVQHSSPTNWGKLAVARLGVDPALYAGARAATGRNAGWRAASGELVLFLDGDTVLAPDFIPAALLELAKSDTTAVVWGHRRELAPGDSIFNRVLDLDWIYAPGTTDFCGGDALFRRAVLVQSGGYNDSLIAGEEPELCARLRALGHHIRHIDATMTGHDLAMRHWRQYWRRAERAGHAYAEVSTMLAGNGTPLWSREAKRNLWHGGLMIATSAAIVVLGLAGAWGAICLLLSAAAAVVVRSAWRSRWKSTQWLTLLAYGIHSHLQQIPIRWGQVLCRQALRRGQGRHLIEYKGPQE